MQQRDLPSPRRSGANPGYSVLSPACSPVGPHQDHTDAARHNYGEGENGAGAAGEGLGRAQPNRSAPDIRELFRDFQDPVSDEGDLTG